MTKIAAQLPAANKEVIDLWIERAQKKLSSFEDKLKRIDHHINILHQEKIAAEATIEYFSLSDKRKSLLLDLFASLDEYGDTESLPEWHLDRLQDHIKSMSDSISHFERCRKRRSDGVAFLKTDLARLDAIRNASYQHPYFFLAMRDF